MSSKENFTFIDFLFFTVKSDSSIFHAISCTTKVMTGLLPVGYLCRISSVDSISSDGYAHVY